MNPILFLSLLSLAPESHARFQPNYIVGGQVVGPRDPVQASTVGIYSQEPGADSGSLCTGTLIGPDMAVTAAHCIEPHVKPELIFGRDLRSPGATHESAEAVAVNPAWAKHAGHGMDQGDIALVKFGGGLPSGYHPVPTMGSEAALQKGASVTLAGYGISNATTKTGAGRLRKTQVSVLNGRPGKTEMILDQTRGRGACHGDSGGPAYVRQGRKIVLAGVTNRGYPDTAPDDCAHQVVYTKIPSYGSWIAQSKKRLENAPAGSAYARRMHASKPRGRHLRVARRQAAPGLHYARRGRHYGRGRKLG